MSKELIERLREPQNVDIGYYWNLADEAADEIERLTAELSAAQNVAEAWSRELTALKAELAGWLKENAPGGWIDELRNDSRRLTAELAEEQAAHIKTHNWLCGRNEELAALKAELAKAKGVKDLWEKTAKSLGAELDEVKVDAERWKALADANARLVEAQQNRQVRDIALKAQSEPVLMMNRVGNTEAVFKDQPQTGGFNIPLYTTPQPASEPTEGGRYSIDTDASIYRLMREREMIPNEVDTALRDTVLGGSTNLGINQYKLVAQSEPVAWMVDGRLCIRCDYIEMMEGWRGDNVGTGRAIPDKWQPVLFTTPQPTQDKLTNQEITEAVARGWCHAGTSHIAMDVYLAEAIVEEINAAIDAAIAKQKSGA